MKFTLLSILIFVSGCSFKKNQLQNQKLKGHHELYSEPSEPKLEKLDEFEKRIVIASTNDIHGRYLPATVSFKDEHAKDLQSTRLGGIDTIQSYFKILRSQYQNLVLVDSGDIFATAHSTNVVKEFYSALDYDALTVGLNDFNLKLPSDMSSSAELFQKFAKTSPTPLLLSNLYELKTARVVEWTGTKPYIMKEMNGVKVGIIGLIPDDIVAQTPVNNRVGLFVESMLQSTLRNARLLRSLGADLIVVITHQGLDCNTELANESKLPISKVNFEPERTSACNLKEGLGDYLERLPHGLVDVVVGGRQQEKIANIVNGTLVMGGYADGKSFSYAEFIVNTKTKKVYPDKTVVHGPVMFCHEFFGETNDCYTEDPSVNHQKRIPATFLGKPVKDSKISLNVEAEEQFSKLSDREIAKSLVNFTAHIAYAPESSGQSQLFVVAVSGTELIKILEEDFNNGKKTRWIPSPFAVKENELNLLIGGLEIESDRTYRILTDLESMQGHRALIKNIAHEASESLKNYSWSSYHADRDSINVKMAAQAR